MPKVSLPIQGSFNNVDGTGIRTIIDITTNPVAIVVERYLDGVQLIPAFEQLSRLDTTVTAIGNPRARIEDLVAGKIRAQEIARSMGLQ